jgi:hypothetical protein
MERSGGEAVIAPVRFNTKLAELVFRDVLFGSADFRHGRAA